jgi:hypothetical protein
MSTIDCLIESLRSLPPDEIRRRLEALDSEQKALRTLLRVRLNSEPKRRPAVAPCSAPQPHTAEESE